MQVSRTILCLLMVSWPAVASQTLRKPIAPGIELSQTIIPASETGGPELIHVLSVQPSGEGIHLEAGLGGGTVEEKGGGMEGVNHQVIRTGALAGINADFFSFTGDPLGLAIHRGELVSEPFSERGAIGFTDRGKVVVGRPAFEGTVTAQDGATAALNGVNRKLSDGEMVLFAPVYGETTPTQPATVAVLEAPTTALKAGVTVNAKVLTVSDEPSAVPMPPKGLVLTATGAAAEWLKAHAAPGRNLELRVDVVEKGHDWGTVREALGGGPVILLNGQEDIQLAREKMGQSFSTTRHPRTAVGVTKDGTVLLVVVDGRQALSRGMSLPELARTMKDLGATDALNLDGGGSTALCVRGLVINCPSDGQVRRVADALLVFDDRVKPLNPAALTASTTESLDLPSDGTRTVAPGQAGGGLLWGTLNGGAFAAQDGGLYGYKPGRAAIVALSPTGKAMLSRTAKVLPGPAGKMLLIWADGTLGITIRDVNNNPVPGQEVTLTKAEGTTTEVTTGADGRAQAPKGWLKDAKEAVTLLSGVLTRNWPDPAG